MKVRIIFLTRLVYVYKYSIFIFIKVYVEYVIKRVYLNICNLYS